MREELAPRSHAEAIAQFRARIVGHLAHQELRHGELRHELRRLSMRRFQPPGAKVTRTYSVTTLERWLYAYKRDGVDALVPRRRSDAGHARALNEDQRKLLLDIRRERPSASARLIVQTLELDGRLERGQVSPSTVRRLFRAEGLPRLTRRQRHPEGARRRWRVDKVGQLWHADVCHGPTLTLDGQRTPLRFHAILDDASRYVVAVLVCDTEREVEMLELMTRALRRWGGGPAMLYLDNGSTYSGEMLATACARLKLSLIHARPYDPQARGKMERFWRTMREGWLDHLGPVTSLHQVRARLLAWLDHHYHVVPHGGLMGRTPLEAWAARDLRPVDEPALNAALTAHGRRRVRKDGTLSVGGLDWEVDQGFLAGRVVRIERSLAEPTAPPVLVHEGERFPLRRVDPVANGKKKRKPFTPKPGIDAIEFSPAEVLLDSIFGRLPQGAQR